MNHGTVYGLLLSLSIFSMASADEVLGLKRDELGYFLRDRGIPYSSRNKVDRQVLATNALQQNLPIVPTLKQDQNAVEDEVKQILTLEDGMIKLPNPCKMTSGWLKTFENFPETTRVEVKSYLSKRSELHGVKTESSKCLKEGESLYLSGHVTGVEYHSISPNINYCFVRATVCRQKAVTQDPYCTWIILHKKTGDIESAYCTCPAGLRKFCKHVLALLHLIIREVEAGCNLAVTSKPREWHKPHKKGHKVHDAAFVRNISIKKVKGSFDSSVVDEVHNKKRLNFDPRALCHQRQKTLADFDLAKLLDITDGNCGVLLYAPREQSCKANETEIQMKPEVMGLSEIDAKVKKDENITLKDYIEKVKVEMTLSKEQINYIADNTIEQSKCAMWFEMRVGRTTASLMKECMGKIDAHGNVSTKNLSFLGKVLGYEENIHTKEMKWGTAMENTAISHYKAFQGKSHSGLTVCRSGLCISQINPFIAGSPDAFVTCKCCGKGVVEVKNPYTARHETISNYCSMKSSCLHILDGKIVLKKFHEYYAQVQCEMYVTDCKYADFVLRTCAENDNIHIERIFCDPEFVSQMVYKSKQVFEHVVLPEMYHRDVKHLYDVKYVKKILNDVINKAMFQVSED